MIVQFNFHLTQLLHRRIERMTDAQAAAVRGVDEPPVDQSGDQAKEPLPAKPLPAPAPQTIAQKVQLAEDFTTFTKVIALQECCF